MEMRSFEEFWPFYVGEHRHPLTRLFHYAGTSAAAIIGVSGIVTGHFWLVPVALTCGYGPAWFSHFFIEKNRPATFKHPLWSFIGDWKMLALGLTGRMGDEVAKLEKSGFRFQAVAA